MTRFRQDYSSQTPRLRAMRKLSRGQWLAGVALLALSVPASAQNIDTNPQWNGTQFISSWGVTNTATYGQTITATATQNRLGGFSFQLSQQSGAAPQYQAFVYQWDAANQRIAGASLYTSGVFTAPAGAAYTPVNFNTGNVVLTPGQQYVLFLSTSNQQPQAAASYRWGSTANTAYAGGQFVFNNNGANFGNLSATSWSTIAQDLAFTAQLGGGFLSPGLPLGAPINPTNVAAGIDKAIAAGAVLPAGFVNLFALGGQPLLDALSQLSGENHTQAQQGAFQLGGSYLSLLTDPFATNRVPTTGTLGYAAEKKLPPAVAAANAMVTKAPPMIYSPRWDVWGAAFGGTNNNRGDLGVVGSHDAYTRVVGVAAGADYRYAPDSLIGFSLAGGNINWSVTGGVAPFTGFGGGASDSFMAGVYGKHTYGPAYVSGALTYSRYWMRTDRTVTVAGLDQLHADFNADSWGGRLEAGYRVPGNWMSIQWTPYGAIQAQSFHTPDYSEVPAANQFALNVASRTATAVRGELGLRTDKIVAIDKGGQLSVFGKLAYAHDEVTDPSINANFAAFGAVGGVAVAPFTVFGARPSHDLALTTTGAEWRLASGVSFMAKFDGEFGDRSRTYAGTARVRYTW